MTSDNRTKPTEGDLAEKRAAEKRPPGKGPAENASAVGDGGASAPEGVPDLAQLVDEYGDYLFRFAYWRVRNREKAEELVQDTFLAAHRALATFEHRASPKTWLVSILRNKIIDEYRKEKRREEESLEDLQAEHPGSLFNRMGIWRVWLKDWRSSPDEMLEQKGFIKQLEECISRLPERFRQLLMLRTFDDVSSKDICEQMKITDKNLWVMLHRARMQLRGCLDSNWFNRPGS